MRDSRAIRSRVAVRAVTAVGLAAIALLGGGCASSPVASTSPTLADLTAGPAAFVIDEDFPDPDVMKVGDTYYAYATNGPGANIRIATSTDLESWSVSTTDALPTLPAWANPGRTWAPDVSDFGGGRFVMYFTAASIDPAVQCIGVATAADPTGPFTPQGDAPLVCPAADGGAIDPSTFVDANGTRYLLFKNDGNCCGSDTWLQIVPLSADGLSLAGEVTKLVRQDQSWEGNLIEAPTLVLRQGHYVLFYSANDYGGDKYATGYASATAVLGPYTKAAQPLLSTSGTGFRGPGGQDIVTAPDGSDRIVFHSWNDTYIYRGMNVEPLSFVDGVPTLSTTG